MEIVQPTPRRKRIIKDPVSTPSRRSARVSKRSIDFEELSLSSEDTPVKKKSRFLNKSPRKRGGAASDDEDDDDEEGAEIKGPSRLKGPKINGKVFGAIPGVEVGAWWEYRDECGRAGVHPPTVAGIYGGEESGCYSVAVSAGYPEDVDLGDTFTYTGSGGRELRKNNLRTAAQSSDQQLVRGNAALDKSSKTGNPIRVIRGYKAPLGPLTGYRYDGLYKVVRSYTAMNSEGKYKVYKFDFERLPGQPPVDYGAKEKELAILKK
ncbi:PUA-like domain-containing protein, partial [Pyronema omphalodes]